jgi:hypothetical protein
VRAHHDCLRAGNRTRETRDHVAAIAAHFLARVVNFNLRSHLFAVFLDAFSDLALLARVTINLH